MISITEITHAGDDKKTDKMSVDFDDISLLISSY